MQNNKIMNNALEISISLFMHKFNAKNIRALFTASNLNSDNGLFFFKLV